MRIWPQQLTSKHTFENTGTMPPKKKEEPKERAVLGRFKSNLKVRQLLHSVVCGACLMPPR